jgi:proteasome lid subunit RPN8/RPN11
MLQLCEYWGPQLERCGFILKDGSIVEMPNVHKDTQAGFKIAPEDILKYEEGVAATWHTHPVTGPNLSPEDYRCFLDWPNWSHFIVCRDKVWGYYVEVHRVLRYDDSNFPRLFEGTLPQGDA